MGGGGWDRANLLLKKKFYQFKISCTCKIVNSCALAFRGREIRTILLFMLLMFLF